MELELGGWELPSRRGHFFRQFISPRSQLPLAPVGPGSVRGSRREIALPPPISSKKAWAYRAPATGTPATLHRYQRYEKNVLNPSGRARIAVKGILLVIDQHLVHILFAEMHNVVISWFELQAFTSQSP